MNKKPYLNAVAFYRVQEKGRRKLHTLVLLLSFFLLAYMMCGFIVIQSLLDEEALVQYCIQAGIELLIILVCIAFLWKGTKLARTLFTLCTILSLYGCFSIYQFCTYPMQDTLSRIIRIAYIVFFVCKSLTLLLCTLRLYQKPICTVWEAYESEGEQAQEEDRILIQHLMEENNQELKKKQSRRKIIIKAHHTLRSYTIGLTVFLYGSMLLFYFGIFIIRYYFPQDGNGIDYVQRYVLLSSLFSALVYSFVAVLMFLYRGAARYALYVAFSLEIIRLVTSFSTTLSTFQSQQYALPSILSLLIIEGIRYIVLLRMMIMFLRDPFLKAYWKIKRSAQ